MYIELQILELYSIEHNTEDYLCEILGSVVLSPQVRLQEEL